MKAYKEFYNEETKKYDYVEFTVAHEFDFTNDPETNLVDTDGGHFICFSFISEAIDRDNTKLESGDLQVLKCKDCGRYFTLTIEEKSWFEESNLMVPKRCIKCRTKRKYERQNKG